MPTISPQQPMRPAEISLVNQYNNYYPQLEFLRTVPALDFGTSNTVEVQGNSNARIDISFASAKTEAPVVMCGLQHESGDLSCVVTGVTNQQFSVTVYNHGNADATGVTIDWLAISGR